MTPATAPKTSAQAAAVLESDLPRHVVDRLFGKREQLLRFSHAKTDAVCPDAFSRHALEGLAQVRASDIEPSCKFGNGERLIDGFGENGFRGAHDILVGMAACGLATHGLVVPVRREAPDGFAHLP